MAEFVEQTQPTASWVRGFLLQYERAQNRLRTTQLFLPTPEPAGVTFLSSLWGQIVPSPEPAFQQLSTRQPSPCREHQAESRQPSVLSAAMCTRVREDLLHHNIRSGTARWATGWMQLATPGRQQRSWHKPGRRTR